MQPINKSSISGCSFDLAAIVHAAPGAKAAAAAIAAKAAIAAYAAGIGKYWLGVGFGPVGTIWTQAMHAASAAIKQHKWVHVLL